MITIPLTYNAATRELTTTAEWVGYTIDNYSVRFSITGIPEGYRAKLDYDVIIQDSRGNQIHPYDHVNLAAGTGYVNLKAVVLRACRRDCRLPIQLVLSDPYGGEVITSTQVAFNITPAIAAYDSQQSTLPFIDQAVAKIREGEPGFIEVTKFNGDTYDVKAGINDFSEIENVPIVKAWTEPPSDANIPSEKLVKDTLALLVDELNEKTPKAMAIPEWESTRPYNAGSAVIFAYELYISTQNGNTNHEPTDAEWWTKVKGGGGGAHESEEYEIGDGTTTEFNIEHGLNTVKLLWNLRIADTGEFIDAIVSVTDESHVKVKFAVAPALNQVKLLLVPTVPSGGGGGGGTWGSITGNINDQLDLKAKLDPLPIHTIAETAPTDATVGKIGDLWTDKVGGKTYGLVDILSEGGIESYIWQEIAGTGGTVTLDDDVTEESANGVKSSGIYRYGQPRVTYGVFAPSGGKDGDLYIKVALL